MAFFSHKPASFTIVLAVLAGGAWFLSYSLGGITHRELADRAIAKRDFQDARKHLEHHLESNPGDTDALLLAARTARRDGDFTAAGKLLAEYERMQRRSPELDFERELLAFQMGDHQAVIPLLNSCRIDPGSDHSELALEAILETLLNIIVQPYASHTPLSHQDLERTAVPHVQETIELWFVRSLSPPERVQGLVWRARLREISGQHTGALEDLRNALALDPDHTYATFLLALFRSQEAPEESKFAFERLSKRHPNDQRFLLAYGETLRVAGHIEEARAVLDRILEREPDSLPALYGRALVGLDLGEPSVAEVLLLRAMKKAPNRPELNSALSRCMRLLGRPDEAAKYQDRFLQLEREQQKPK